MIKRLFSQFAQSSSSIRIAMGAVIGIWALVLVAIVVSIVLFLERPGQALPPTPGVGMPEIILEPTAGPRGTFVTVRGQGWTLGSTLLIYLKAPGQSQTPGYAVASATADAEGRFTTGFMVPSEPGWEGQGWATVIARAA